MRKWKSIIWNLKTKAISQWKMKNFTEAPIRKKNENLSFCLFNITKQFIFPKTCVHKMDIVTRLFTFGFIDVPMYEYFKLHLRWSPWVSFPTVPLRDCCHPKGNGTTLERTFIEPVTFLGTVWDWYLSLSISWDQLDSIHSRVGLPFLWFLKITSVTIKK